MANWKVPLADIDLGDGEIQAVTDILRSRWLSMGPVTAEFERHFADYVGVKYAFAVANGTAALHLAHLALGAGPGDTVLCPSLTFVATANAIRYTGATPVFVDVTNEDNLNISPDDVATKIDATTKGICVVHYGGYPCDMERIMRIARHHQLYVVEDAAHAPGASCWVSDPDTSEPVLVLKKCGSVGDIGCFSFFSNKNMTTAEGGMITTNDPELADKIGLLRSHGMTSLTWDREQGHSFSYDVVALGYNYRIDEIRSSIGLAQLKKVDVNNQRRAEIVQVYRELLSEVEGISIPSFQSECNSSYHLFPIILKHEDQRLQFMNFLRNSGIQTSIHYPPIHQFTKYVVKNESSDLIVTNNIAKRIVTLPLFSTMTFENIEYVVSATKDFFSNRHSRSKISDIVS